MMRQSCPHEELSSFTLPPPTLYMCVHACICAFKQSTLSQHGKPNSKFIKGLALTGFQQEEISSQAWKAIFSTQDLKKLMSKNF